MFLMHHRVPTLIVEPYRSPTQTEAGQWFMIEIPQCTISEWWKNRSIIVDLTNTSISQIGQSGAADSSIDQY